MDSRAKRQEKSEKLREYVRCYPEATYTGIARHFGCGYTHVRGTINRVGINYRKRKTRRLSSGQLKEYVRLHPEVSQGGTCGKRLIVHNARSKFGAYYPYFVCAGKLGKGTERKRCGQHAVLIQRVEELIEGLYEHISLTPESRHLLEAWLAAEWRPTNCRLQPRQPPEAPRYAQKARGLPPRGAAGS
ncbi:MAG: hypothetical protein LBU07_03055 [Coriobacteriales bacterium]|jgi:hypothetical protein|nr:hypothetical protein [Coriobacteriales bacterium]